MKKRRLGTSNLDVAPLAFGGNVFGWTVDEKTSFALLDAFVDAGFNLIDTADVYSRWVPSHQGGESETIIGRWLQARGRRADVVIATKVGMDMGGGNKGLSKNYIIRSAEASLKRLRTDHIDLYQSHADDPDTPMEETLSAYDELIKAGKVRAIGASNFEAQRLREALSVSERRGLPSYVSLQPPYNLYDREGFEKELEPLVLEKNVGVICYYGLASGFLSGKYRSEADLGKSPRGAGIAKKYFNDRGWRILKAIDEVAARRKAAAATVSLAWLMQRKSVTAPIASATTVEQLGELTSAVALILSPDDVKTLDEASAWLLKPLEPSIRA